VPWAVGAAAASTATRGPIAVAGVTASAPHRRALEAVTRAHYLPSRDPATVRQVPAGEAGWRPPRAPRARSTLLRRCAPAAREAPPQRAPVPPRLLGRDESTPAPPPPPPALTLAPPRPLAPPRHLPSPTCRCSRSGRSRSRRCEGCWQRPGRPGSNAREASSRVSSPPRHVANRTAGEGTHSLPARAGWTASPRAPTGPSRSPARDRHLACRVWGAALPRAARRARAAPDLARRPLGACAASARHDARQGRGWHAGRRVGRRRRRGGGPTGGASSCPHAIGAGAPRSHPEGHRAPSRS
jgi:hypothetical protein